MLLFAFQHFPFSNGYLITMDRQRQHPALPPKVTPGAPLAVD